MVWSLGGKGWKVFSEGVGGSILLVRPLVVFGVLVYIEGWVDKSVDVEYLTEW